MDDPYLPDDSGPGSSEPFDPQGAGGAATDSDLLDAYSHAVVAVVSQAGAAVVNIAAGDARGRRGAGSGVMVAPDGYLLTNNHVVEAAESLTVSFTDGLEAAAELVGRDPATDLAVLRARGSGLPYAELGDSSRLQVGQLAIAIGNPLGYASSVSTGVVSALGRSLASRNGRLIEGVIQHTAPLNPGNSGGALLDSRGRVTGINTAIIAMAQNLGFAIPVNTARWVLSQLLTRGRVLRGYLGIAGRERPLDRRLVRHLDLERERGVEIMSMEKESPAGTAGLRSGDIILTLAGRAVQDIPDLQRVLGELPVGEPALMEVLRRTRRLSVSVVPAEAPSPGG